MCQIERERGRKNTFIQFVIDRQERRKDQILLSLSILSTSLLDLPFCDQKRKWLGTQFIHNYSV